MVINLCPVIAPTDGIRHKQTETAAFVGENEFGVGTLYIAESTVIWILNDGRGFSLPYPSISMHAISRDTRNFSRPCIYMVIDLPDEKVENETKVSERCFADKLAACSLKADSAGAKSEVGAAIAATSDDGEHNGSAHEESDDDEHSKTVEIRFVPHDLGSLETMYQALSECQALHPDENESFSDDDDGDECDEPQHGGASDEFQFDDHGQLVLSRMRGVRPDEEGAGAMEHDQPSGPAQDDDEEMETGQFEDAQ